MHVCDEWCYVAGKKRRLTLIECGNDLNTMIDIAKIADLVRILRLTWHAELSEVNDIILWLECLQKLLYHLTLTACINPLALI